MIPGVSQVADLDYEGYILSNGSPGATYTGTATSDLTIDGVTEPISDAFTYATTPSSLTLSFSGGAAVVFNLGTFEVTVTPISTSGEREADSLETPLTSAPEPSSLTLLASSALLAALTLAWRSRPGRRVC